MGEKDFQQFFLVKNFIEKRFNTKIIGCKTIRNRNNLALSSRNLLFTKKELTDDLEKADRRIKRENKLKEKLKQKQNI